MKVFLDERCLTTADLASLLRLWLAIADFVAKNANSILLYMDRRSVYHGPFQQRLNTLKSDERLLYVPMLFGSEQISDWRPESIGAEIYCQLATENDPVADCAICEAYEHRKLTATTALFGHQYSSYMGHLSVGVARIDPHGDQVDVLSGTALADLQRIGALWNCLLIHYDLGLRRPPRDYETSLGRDGARFARLGRFERNGRRNVYRELATNRLFYVDNLHYGPAAHLEVFDATGVHLGTADLNGGLDESTAVPGRVISW